MENEIFSNVGKTYNNEFKCLEQRARKHWVCEDVDGTHKPSISKPNQYILAMFPYPSGDAHLGHVRVYSISDAMARMARFKGYNVLHPLGWDAFGLPAENTAIQNNIHPAKWVESNIEKMRGKQLGELGFSFDHNYEINTASPQYYKWTQWLFIQLYKEGIIYRSHEMVNWDPIDNTVLANEQVIDGKGWRSGAPIERRKMEQWNIRITDYAEDLWNGLDSLDDWPEMAKAAQRHWIGRSTGAIITFKAYDCDEIIEVFTTCPETLFGVSALILAPEHNLVPILTAPNQKANVEAYITAGTKISDVDRESNKDKSGIFLGTFAVHPLTEQHIPIYIANYILPSHGTGSVMSVPAHDERDFEFAEKYDLPIKQVISKSGKEEMISSAFTDHGIMINSGQFDGKSSEESRHEIIRFLEEKGVGRKSIQYRLRDWSISRQRFWGAPIPMRKDLNGNWSPVPDEQLPVQLPNEVDFSIADGKSPLARNSKFFNYRDPNTGEEYIRETDTMDTFMCSSWYIWRFIDPLNKEKPWSIENAKAWMPLDIYVGGLEHANQHMIYLRFMSHFLFSRGMTPVKEPVTKFLCNGMVRLNGTKMSKSKGNVVRPDEMISKYGADALRMYILSDTPFDRHIDWSEEGLKSKNTFLSRVYTLYNSMAPYVPKGVIELPTNVMDASSRKLILELSKFIESVDTEISKHQKFHVLIAKIHSFFNLLLDQTRNRKFQDEEAKIIAYTMQSYLKVLGLVAPHISEILWRDTFEIETSIFKENWPIIEKQFSENEIKTIDIPIMINGKKLGMINLNPSTLDTHIVDTVKSSDFSAKIMNATIQKVVIVRENTEFNTPKLINIVAK